MIKPSVVINRAHILSEVKINLLINNLCKTMLLIRPPRELSPLVVERETMLVQWYYKTWG